MQGYKEIALTDVAKEAVMQLQENIKVVATSYAGSAFPTTNLYDGLVCYRTDKKRPYIYNATSESWEAVGVTAADYATEAATAGKATQDASGNVITTTYATKAEVSSLAKALKYKGSVATYADLPTDAEVGDVWNVQKADKTHSIKAGENVAWTGEAWDNLGGTVDLTDYALVTDQQKDVISASVASDTITLTARDGTATKLVVNNVAEAVLAAQSLTAESASKATGDGDGNTISTTYAKKVDEQGDVVGVTATNAKVTVTKKDGTTSTFTIDEVDSAANAKLANIATTALKASMDEDGNTISKTYAKSASLATVATSGSYEDLTNKPTIPSEYTLPTASSSTLGGVKVGSGLAISSGTLSVSSAPSATKAEKDASGNVITSTYAKASSLAAVATTGSYTDLTNKPTIPAAYTLPTASSSTLGGIKVGTGLSISNGVLSNSYSYTLPNATSSVLGGIKVGTGLSVSSGVLSIGTATSSTLGGVKIGSNLSISSGVLSVPTASSSTAGVIKVGSYLSISSGVLTVTGAPSATKATNDSDGNAINTTYLKAANVGEISSDDITAICDVLEL